jgi:hypothetical protein
MTRKNRVSKGIASKLQFFLIIILDLKYFDLKDNKLILTDQTLFTEKEIFFMLDSKKDGKDLWWNN